jgi:hypothetical protein
MDGRVNNSGTIGNAGGGRKTLEEEIRVTKEKIKQEALVELANRVMYKRLTALEDCENVGQEKDFALPIALKGMTEKVDNKHTVNVIKMDESILDKYVTTPEPESNSEEPSQV